jgi:ribonuclease D
LTGASCGVCHERGLLACELPKPKHLRCGDWRAQPLSAEQLEYGALDAVAGQRCYAALLRGAVSG